MGFNSAFKGLKLFKKPGNGRLNNLNDPVLNVLKHSGHCLVDSCCHLPRQFSNHPRLAHRFSIFHRTTKYSARIYFQTRWDRCFLYMQWRNVLQSTVSKWIWYPMSRIPSLEVTCWMILLSTYTPSSQSLACWLHPKMEAEIVSELLDTNSYFHRV